VDVVSDGEGRIELTHSKKESKRENLREGEVRMRASLNRRIFRCLRGGRKMRVGKE